VFGKRLCNPTKLFHSCFGIIFDTLFYTKPMSVIQEEYKYCNQDLGGGKIG